jgi:hypothetical protein
MKTARAKQQIKQNQQQYCMRHMPAAMVHGGSGGVLLMMTTKLASQQTIKKHKVTNQNSMEALSFKQPHPTQNNSTKSQAKKTMAVNTLLLQTNLLQSFKIFK